MKRILRSFIYAWAGLKVLISEEINYLIHLLATLSAIALGFWLQISSTEWALVILIIALVLITETINTAVENIMDFVSTKRQPKIARIKDLAAAAVLVSAITSLVIGLIIFLPKIIQRF